MSNKFANRVFVTTATTGTGTITLGSPLAGYQSFAAGGVANADVVRYLLLDGSEWETGTGTYTASGTTLSRTPTASSNSNAAINLSGGGRVAVIASAEDYAAFLKGPTSAGNNHVALFDGTTDRLIKGVAQLPLAQGGTGAATAAAARTNLGLGTAATGTLTTSVTDSTVGRVLRVADFGLGSGAVALTGSDSLASRNLQTGTYAYVGTLIPDAPRPLQSFNNMLQVSIIPASLLGAGNVRRLYLNVQGSSDGTQRLWIGANQNTDTILWREIYHQGFLLGTVSQTGGVPTGALFQGNASASSPTGGFFERTATGFQVCHHTLTSSASEDTTWTYNTAFLTGSSPVISITPIGDASYRVRLVSRSATAAIFSIRDGSDNRVAVSVDLIARGRWSNMT
jgi:hypothetical protein